MKHFTLFLFAFCVSFGASAQADLSLDDITAPAAGDTFLVGSSHTLTFTVTNNGPNDLNVGDTILATYTFDAGANTQAGASVLGATFASGSTLTFNFQDPITLPATPVANAEICMNVISANDPNLANNTRCNNFALHDPVSVIEITTDLSKVYYSNNELVMNFVNATSGTANVNVIDITGRVITMESLNLGSGNSTERIGLGELPQGIYFSTVTFEDSKSVTTKFMVN